MSEYKKPAYGLYSKEADRCCGHVICETVDGEIVKVTCVCSEMEYPEYKWQDTVYVGRLYRYIKTNIRR